MFVLALALLGLLALLATTYQRDGRAADADSAAVPDSDAAPDDQG